MPPARLLPTRQTGASVDRRSALRRLFGAPAIGRARITTHQGMIMNTQLITARDTRGAQLPTTTLDRLARRTGLALVRWSARRSGSTSLSGSSVQALDAMASLRSSTVNETQQQVLLVRPF